MIIAKAIGAQVAITAGYLGGIRSYLPKRALVLQGSAIAVSALVQTYRPYTQAALAKQMPRSYAFYLLNFQPFILIGALGVVAKVGWKINLAATLFFSFLQLGISKYVSIKTSVIPTEKKAKELLKQFKKELKQGSVNTSAKTLKKILELRKENPFLCVASYLKVLYAEGVIHFCLNLPQDEAAAIRWYNEIDSTIYRPNGITCGETTFLLNASLLNKVFSHLIKAGVKLGIQKDWLKEMPPLRTLPDLEETKELNFLRMFQSYTGLEEFLEFASQTKLYFRALALTFNLNYSERLSTELSSVWENNYYFYLLKVKGEKEADAYFKKHEQKIDDKTFFSMQQEALLLGENAIAFHCLMKELEANTKNLDLIISTRGDLLLQHLGSETLFFETFQDKVPFEHKDSFQKIQAYVTSSGIPPGFDDIYEIEV
ncbi:MAG: hypothetical protein H7A41_07425 [Chlamydiales bacterium]|nr:hypothetical protein [Chlamydiales bacterium]